MDGFRLERQSSIENEPRTLSIHQIDYAREAAMYVVNTRSIEEALRIFTEGLEPVARCAESGQRCHAQEREEEQQQKQYSHKDQRNIRIPNIRDIVSAPF
ncbi:hypothetical protein CDL12_21929 [Handroanthus impetiginosus]|uniref:Uncharacterized protein n=1 Tax=Handroanthus impetiginosus TaxID=429701 RepID=A0A2G9GJS3_9LAMI|nr:hypothetical protein CDL12_21929 [Handroanthus impetiginosus]